ncbi:beta-galactosidase, partial [bacterium]|nr:beta-galactosidase [bacterium]
MPPITFDGRSLLIAGRRTTLIGAGCEYAMLPRAEQADRLRQVAQLGCNTVIASCPWFLHEPIAGHFDFEGDLNISEFLADAQSAGLRVILRIGPVIGAPFDGGGLPTWLGDRPEVATRTGTPGFLKLTSSWFRKITAE